MINEVVTRLKNNDIKIPLWLGQLISNIPYSVRPIVGKYYRIRREELRRYKSYSIGERQMFIFNRMYKIVKYSLEYISFYKKKKCAKIINIIIGIITIFVKYIQYIK